MAATTPTRLDEIKAQLSADQLAFLAERVLCRTDKEAAESLGFGYSTVLSWPEKRIINEAVNLILEDSLDLARDLLKRNLVRAAKVKVRGLDSKKAAIAQGAATEILDRFMGKPTQSVSATVNANVTVVKGYMTVSPDDWDSDTDSGVQAATVADSAVA